MAECIDNEWLKKEVNKTELNMPLEDAYRWIKDSYLHHKTERNDVLTPKAELIALMCINIFLIIILEIYIKVSLSRSKGGC